MQPYTPNETETFSTEWSKTTAPEVRPIRVLLIEDMDLIRGALVSLLSQEDDIEVVADLKCDDKVVSTALQLRPDVVVVDIDLSGEQGLTMVRELRRRMPACQIVALAAAKPVGLLQRLLAAEVWGAVDKNAPAGRLLRVVRMVADGERVVDANLAAAALSAELSPFTARELQVLRLAADGISGREIADRLSLSNGTVRNYLSKVMTKTYARNRIDAIRIAREAGWL
ncbi:MAG: response regulator transcription factor [Pseudonocardiales bacterium]|nr:response regulator transcription factor [Pseudonocardiales bacterium]